MGGGPVIAAAAINQFNHLFSLRMRKERLIGLICCFAAGSEIWKLKIFNGAAALERMRWIGGCAEWVGYGRCSANGSAQESKPTQTNPSIPLQQSKRKGVQLFFAAVNSWNEVKWIDGAERRRANGAPSSSGCAARQKRNSTKQMEMKFVLWMKLR